MIGKTLGHYRVMEKLGAGGMGEVYRAEDTNLSRQVAIKVLPDHFAGDPVRLARFEREAKLLASLNHPNIASIYGLEEADGNRFLVLELVEGQTLAKRLQKGSLPVEEALDVCRQIAEGLEVAHDRGIIHRDLKPANVMVTPEGKVKILDFGLARAYQDLPLDADPADSPTVTRPGVVVGTGAYMSPEQAKGKPVDKRADIWCFGCVLYECLAGERAFQGETVTEAVASILKSEPDWGALPPATPQKMVDLLHRCLRKDPRERLHDIGDARIEIADSLGEAPAAETAHPARPRRRWLGSAAAAVAAVAFFLAGVFVERSITRPPRSPVIRSSILLPAGTQLIRGARGPARTEIALSHDGSRLVFSASGDGSGSRSMLYMRAMDRAGASALPGTEGASMPFFSPDDQWIGFWAKQKLCKVPSGGGIPTILCDLADLPMGASWGPDGRIVIGTLSEGLKRIPDGGGMPEVITKINPTNESSHRLPCLLPGGKALAFTVMTHLWGVSAHLELLLLKTGERRVLIEDATDAHYTTTGHLVFARRGTIMAAPFDPNRSELIGPAAPVIDGVLQSINETNSGLNSAAGQYQISDSGSLVYAAGGIYPDPELQWNWVDRKGVSEPIGAIGHKPFMTLRVSPDGKRIASCTTGSDRNIWVHDIVRGTSTKLTRDGQALFPVWTPDGTRVVFAWSRAGKAGIWSCPAEGGEMELLTQGEFSQYPGSWTRDGKYLALVENNSSTGYDILVLGMEDRRLSRFLATKSAEGWPEFSPDGRWIAYVSDESGRNEVYVRSFPAGDKVVMISNQGGQTPVWGPDGQELFYWDADTTKLMWVEVRPGQPLAAGTPRVFWEFATGSPSPIRGYDITPDGKRFLIRGRTKYIPTEVTQLNLILNWFEELERLVPPDKK